MSKFSELKKKVSIPSNLAKCWRVVVFPTPVSPHNSTGSLHSMQREMRSSKFNATRVLTNVSSFLASV